MPRPSLLILGVDYAPDEIGIAPYTTGLAQHLADRGHIVTVTTTFPHYPQYRWREAGQHRFAAESLNGVRVRRLWTLLPSRQTALRRIAFDSSMGVAGLLGSIGITRPDIIISVSPPVQLGLAGSVLARAWGSVHVLLIKDLPLEAAIGVGMMRKGLMLRLAAWVERTAYRLAGRIVVINKRFGAKLAGYGVDGEKVFVIPDWANLAPARPDSRAGFRKKLGAASDDVLVIHAGNMGKKQGLDSVLDAAKHLGSNQHIRFYLVGDGSEAGRLRRRAVEMQLSNLSLLPIQPAEELPGLLAAGDILLLNQGADVVDSVVPSKLLAYMSAGKPVLAAVSHDSVAADLIREADCGEVVRAGEGRALADAIVGLGGSAQLRKQLGEAGRAYVLQHFAPEVVLQRWESFLDGLVQSTAGSL